jgi:hypothetical protein
MVLVNVGAKSIEANRRWIFSEICKSYLTKTIEFFK